MRNGRWTLLGICGVLFVLSSMFPACQMGLSQSDTSLDNPDSSQSDTSLDNPDSSQSDAVIIIKEIHASEKRVLKEIHTLNIEMAVLKTKVTIIQWVGTILVAPILIYFITLGVQRVIKRNSESAASPVTDKRSSGIPAEYDLAG